MKPILRDQTLYVWFARDGTPWGTGARCGDAMAKAIDSVLDLSIEAGEGTESDNLRDVISSGDFAVLLLPSGDAAAAFLDHVLHGA